MTWVQINALSQFLYTIKSILESNEYDNEMWMIDYDKQVSIFIYDIKNEADILS